MNIVIVRDNIIENIGTPPMGTPPAGTTAHEFNGFASIGWLWNNGNPVDPNPAPPPIPDGRAATKALDDRRADELAEKGTLDERVEALELRIKALGG